MRGGTSGGTIASIGAVVADSSMSLRDPYVLVNNPPRHVHQPLDQISLIIN